MNNLLKALTLCGEQFKDSSFTIVDMHQADQPLVYVNQYFLEMTGYPKEEILEKNCRFLQGRKSNQKTLKSLRSCLNKGIACYHDLINYKKDGTPFWNRLCLFPIEHEVVGLKYYVGIQLDVTENKTQQEKRELKDFIKDESLVREVYDQLENPLMELMGSTRALKYFVEDDEQSLIERSRLAKKVVKNVEKMTDYVASL